MREGASEGGRKGEREEGGRDTNKPREGGREGGRERDVSRTKHVHVYVMAVPNSSSSVAYLKTGKGSGGRREENGDWINSLNSS